jgi:hypothetical protein
LLYTRQTADLKLGADLFASSAKAQSLSISDDRNPPKNFQPKISRRKLPVLNIFETYHLTINPKRILRHQNANNRHKKKVYIW